MNILEVILVIIGIAFIVVSMIGTTKNTISTLVYKVFPFLSGCYCIFFALMTSQIISINI